MKRKFTEVHGSSNAGSSSGSGSSRDRWVHQPAPSIVGSDTRLVAKILSHLPTESVFRLRCVSKTWASVTDDPYFRADHARRNPYPISGFILNKYSLDNSLGMESFSLDGCSAATRLPDPSFSFVRRHHTGAAAGDYHVRHSCNGLMIICRRRTTAAKNNSPSRRPRTSQDSDQEYYVCNPTTMECEVLPITTSVGAPVHVYLGFDPSKSPRYKVVVVRFRASGARRCDFFIYSSETRLISTFQAGTILPNDVQLDQGVFWNGALNWLTSRTYLFSLDLFGCDEERNETAWVAQAPSAARGQPYKNVYYFGECRGRLHMIANNHNDGGGLTTSTAVFDVLEMKGDYSGWSVLYHVDHVDHLDLILAVGFQQRAPAPLEPIFVAGGVEEEGEDDVVMLLSIPGDIVAYSLRDAAIKKIQIMDYGNRVFQSSDFFPYGSTLAPL